VTTRENRLRDNQRAFRTANERLDSLVEAEGRLIPFLCECVDETCTASIELTAARYEDLHADEAAYVVVTGHPLLPGEKVTEEHDNYQVVRK
jgi:hypothetical protein